MILGCRNRSTNSAAGCSVGKWRPLDCCAFPETGSGMDQELFYQSWILTPMINGLVGKSTGSHRCSHEICCFPVSFQIDGHELSFQVSNSFCSVLFTNLAIKKGPTLNHIWSGWTSICKLFWCERKGTERPRTKTLHKCDHNPEWVLELKRQQYRIWSWNEKMYP